MGFSTELKYYVASFLLWTLGWRFKPSYNKPYKRPLVYITFGEPHTHIFDFLYMILFMWSYRVTNARFPVNNKHVKGLQGVMIRSAGGIAIDTSGKVKNGL